MNAKPSDQTAGLLELGFLRLRSNIIVSSREDAQDDGEIELLQFAAFAAVLGPTAAETLSRHERPSLQLHAALPELDQEHECACEARWAAGPESEED